MATTRIAKGGSAFARHFTRASRLLPLRHRLAALILLLMPAPAVAQSIDVPALWQRYLDTCTPFVTDVTAATAALEPLAEGAEMARSEDGQAMRYELGDEDGLIGNHIYVNRAGQSSGVYCEVFDFRIGDLGAEELAAEVSSLLERETGAPASGGASAISGHPTTGVRIFGSSDYWASFSTAGALPRPEFVTGAEIQREDFGGVFATGVTFTLYATVPDAE
ncbi:MAG: hypothetical protein AAFR47_11470 [Pseudomonadota bacterium]